MQSSYALTLRWSLAPPAADSRLLFAASLVATVGLFRVMPEDFIPAEDTGRLNAYTEGANGISFEAMSAHQAEAAQIVWNDPNVEGGTSSVGSGGARGGSNQGSFVIVLKPRGERLPINQVMAELRRKFARIPGLNVYLQNRPPITIGGLVSKAQYQYTMQDASTDELYAASTKLKAALAKTPGFLDVTSDLDLSTPSVHVAVNRDRAAALGVSMNQIETALGASFGGQQVSIINTSADQFKVMLELLPMYQRDAASLQRLYLSGTNGALVPLPAVTEISNRGFGRYGGESFPGQLPAVTVSFSLPPGRALSDAVATLEEVKAQIGMPASVQGSFQGTAKAFQQSMKGMGFLLMGGILVVYIVLGILYESFIHPLDHFFQGPRPSAAVRSALLTLWLFGVPADALRLRRDDHAGRNREEKRHHDDRLRAGARARARR